MRARCSVAVVTLLLLAAPLARAQGVSVVPEARVDAILARRSAIQPALGADVALASALHLELAVGLGASWGGSAPVGPSARADAIVHFLLDPQHTMRWSPYGGGGVGARYDHGPEWRAVAILVVGVNAPRWGPTRPFIEAGFGGGLRLGAGFRLAHTPR
jgi:hypothetical protein